MKMIKGILLSIVISQVSWAITIESFQDGFQSLDTFVLDTSLLPITDTDETASTSSMGGFRNITQTTSPTAVLASDMGLKILNGKASIYNGGTMTSVTCMIWDADNLPGVTNYAGLGGVDLLSGNASQFEIEVSSFDKPLDKSAVFELKVWDASDSTGDTWSFGSSVLYTDIIYGVDAPHTLFLNFNSFATFGPNGAADLTNVGAIELCLDTHRNNAEDVDIVLEYFGTDSDCEHIPDKPGAVIDDCGVCNGDNGSCMDCNNEPNGDYVPGSMCQTGEHGVCANGKLNTSCECIANPSSTEVCDELDNDCDGQVDERFDGAEDGSVCIPCDPVDNTPQSYALDGYANELNQIMKKVGYSLKFESNKKSDKKLVKQLNKLAQDAYVQAWKISWSIPAQSYSCPLRSSCQVMSVDTEIAAYTESVNTIIESTNVLLAKLKKYNKKKFRKLSSKLAELIKSNESLVSSLNTSYTVCK